MAKLSPVHRRARTAWINATAMLLIAGCDRAEAPTATASDEPLADTPVEASPATLPIMPPPLPAASGTSTPDNVATLVPESEKGETGARNVLLTWARALENGNYDAAYAQWGEAGERSGMDAAAHADYWRKYSRITIAVPKGTMDAGAGSLFYEVPAVVTGTDKDGRPFRLEGTVFLRRVNDVDGATPAQLRWHIDRVDLKPA
ncbi:hypothetical protein GRI97_16370 [Altererythrobacter xixiisoli]|uniref:Lipoprotein n=1 Tax=Croceibacterium xixiisoli TaxID=1476466 RepID=A0A6I4TX17_9SPHN|nr:hypothetical protein [Croceibacterium xixiisoli]MXP00567.1 hypothetical protein [Croceibacterium xixiisoli]